MNLRKDFVRIAQKNGYHLVRTKGSHMIFQNESGRTMAVNIHLNKMVAKRLIKEYDLKIGEDDGI